LQETFKPTLGASSFAPLGGEGQGVSKFSQIPLGRRVRIVKLMVSHEPEPREKGEGAIYFFPGGQTEHAVLQLAQGDDRVYSVEISPLTGRGKVYSRAYQPEFLLGNPEESDRSEVEAP
jgi:general secretion pathway protein H